MTIAVARCAGDLAAVDPLRVATRTIGSPYDGASAEELDRLSIQTPHRGFGRGLLMPIRTRDGVLHS